MIWRTFQPHIMYQYIREWSVNKFEKPRSRLITKELLSIKLANLVSQLRDHEIHWD